MATVHHLPSPAVLRARAARLRSEQARAQKAARALGQTIAQVSEEARALEARADRLDGGLDVAADPDERADDMAMTVCFFCGESAGGCAECYGADGPGKAG